MKTFSLQIDGKTVEANEGDTILQVARREGIDIPALCFHEQLSPYGACRLCTVEIVKGPKTRLVASCVYPAEEGLEVITRSERIDKIRKMLLELMLPLASTGPVRKLAREYGADASRFAATTEDVGCNLCGLCVRYCAEVKGAHAITFVGRGIHREVTFIPEIASKVCDNCRECFALCPGGKLPGVTDGAWFQAAAFES